MAVYTNISIDTLSLFIDNYEIGQLKNHNEILEGVENTNYQITTTKNNYILTIFEKRVKENELPFFIELQNHLFNKKIKCPQPIKDKKGQFINHIENKPCVIMSFLKGHKVQKPTYNHCVQVGEHLANMHKHTKDYSLRRENSLSQKFWKPIFEKCKQVPKNTYSDLFETIEKELQFLETNWPINLPKGVIHADVFQDNVFFIDDILSGFIDFYFACNDFYAYELAICINAWCFDENNNFNKKKYLSILEGYEKIQKLSLNELEKLHILLRGASMRILLTRLHDLLYHPAEAYVTPKDPMEYFNILKFHINNPILNK